MLINIWRKDTSIHVSAASLHQTSIVFMSLNFPNLDFSPISLVFIMFLVTSAFIFLYSLVFWWRFVFYKPKNDISSNHEGVSVIIAARNEEDNLYNNLEHILTQDYPLFEVIVVNHQSSDDTKHILGALQKQYVNLKVIEIERNKHLKVGKKLPITLGVKGAKFDKLLFTDADCRPAGNQWLKEIAGCFSEKHAIILGYGPYQKTKGLLNALIRFDTIQIAINYFSFAVNGMAYMGVGRNLAYKKSTFESVGGFKSHYGIASGDDDLFIRDAATKGNTMICLNPDTFCYSEPKTSWRDWFKQKQRHYTTSGHYKVITKLLLGFFPLALLIQLFSFVILLLHIEFWFWACLIFGGSLILRWIAQVINFNKLGAAKLAIFYPVLEYVHILITALMYYSRGYSENKWS
jgi:cellulose synthase/poly-beta-1,6-N-acetylglucosamine synthase-like glycosyltransferase